MVGDNKDKPGSLGERTVFVPSGEMLPTPPSVAQPNASPAANPPSQTSRPSAIPEGGLDSGQHRQIQIGDVLNHIFEVKRFIARGGMGEVFEGSNVNSDERVAIKVMLPSLAADTNVLAMFRKEARTLTRLSHPALVQYRVLAQEPQLGVFYIVTEFVDGQNLSDVITELKPTTQDLIDLTRRLAGGLRAAHELGAIHRDISPDNVMLEGGNLSGAKIIDFGIAKDLDPGSATIIGDGFAGKLNYVAPEQLGDFNRSIGPWTDVYSLGLVILAVAMRKDVNMGGTLVDAVDKRRAGPDLSQAPEELRPLLERMVKPNPTDRPQSMSELLALLPKPGAAATPNAAAAPPPTKMVEPPKVEPPKAESPRVEPPEQPAPAPKIAAHAVTPSPGPKDFAAATATKDEPAPVIAKPQPAQPETNSKSRMPLIAGAGAALAVLVGTGAYFGLSGGSKDTGQAPVAASAQLPDSPVTDPVTATRDTLNTGLASVGCTWLDIADVSQSGESVVVALRGVAGKPGDAQGQIARLLAGKKLNVSAINFQDVSPIEATECGPLDALRQVRDVSGGRISVPQRQFEMSKATSGQYAGSLAAKAVVNFNFSEPALEMSLFGIEPSGEIKQLTTERAELIGASEELGNNQYRLSIDINHTGWSGLLLLTGNKPFDGDLLNGPAGSRTGDWSNRFLTAAKERGWKSEMIWFKTVDEQAN